MKLRLGFLILLIAGLMPTSAGADGGPYGKGVRLKLIEISPDRSLPIVVDAGRFAHALHHFESITAQTAIRRERERLKPIGGWSSFATPSRRGRTFDNATIDFLTNDPQVVRRDASRIFKAIGCMPVAPLGDPQPLLDTIGVAVFDDLVFVHGGDLGTVVLARNSDTREYRYVSQTRARSLPLGEVNEYVLGDRRAYVFVQNTEWRDMEAWYPTRLRIIVFDDTGRAVLGDGKPERRVNGVAVEGRDLVLERDTLALNAPPFPGNSVVFCPHAKNAQYSLLDPVNHEPVSFQSRLHLEYLGGRLQPVGIHLGLVHPGTGASQGLGIACRGFTTLEEIEKAHDFGLGHWNDDHTKWISGGTAEGYIKGSLEFSGYFWSGLHILLEGAFLVPVEVDPELQQDLDTFWRGCDTCPSNMPPPTSLGDDEAFSFLKLVKVAEPETREGTNTAAGKQANPGDGSSERGGTGHTARAQANPRTKPAEPTRPSGHEANETSSIQSVAGAQFLTAEGKPITDIQVMLQPNLIRLRVSAEDTGPERTYDIVFLKRGKEVSRHALTALRKNGDQAPGGKAVYEALFYLTVPHLPGNEACDPSIPKLMSPGGLIDIVVTDPASGRHTPKIGR